WNDYAFDGYPPPLHPPLIIKMILKLRKNSFLRGPMPAGVNIPRIAGGTMGTDVLSLDEGLSRFRLAMERLRSTAPSIPSPIFGPLTHDQWIGLNLRHAELHLSFF